MSTTRKKRPGGRPPKFGEPSHPITVTLPDRVIRELAEIASDRGQAIVEAVVAFRGVPRAALPAVERVRVGLGTDVLVVAESRRLRTLSWLRLVEIAPGRHLLAMPSGTPVDSLELAILDLLDDPAPIDAAERAVLEGLKRELAQGRRRESITRAELLFITGGAAHKRPARS
jgi:hypothetical protein